MICRRLGPEDLGAFRAIRLEALEREPAAFASLREAWAALPEAEWLRRLTANPVFAAFDGAEPVGLIGLLPETGPRTGHRASLVMVYLRAEYRGRGLAAALFAGVEAEARRFGLRQIELGVAAENHRALRFYERMGFAVAGRLTAGYIHEGREIDEVLMVKRLGGS